MPVLEKKRIERRVARHPEAVAELEAEGWRYAYQEPDWLSTMYARPPLYARFLRLRWALEERFYWVVREGEWRGLWHFKQLEGERYNFRTLRPGPDVQRLRGLFQAGRELGYQEGQRNVQAQFDEAFRKYLEENRRVERELDRLYASDVMVEVPQEDASADPA